MTSDKKILELIEVLKESGKIRFKKEFYDAIGLQKQNVFWIKNQNKQEKQSYHFTAEHIEKICKTYSINANWIFGMEKNTFLISKTHMNKEKIN
ncbi:hypothetical protein ETU10_08355 [Apibacter muscae]|uniref:hypothetical protein n=1 Tax=Apibacter muscae TaxID=2509004 RepID=UPI0011ABFCAA|nr:hypothetical protein [Apibacter muscae]TWP23097.1 hypothetical protein ETU10_08355 [Apibacter muscae]